MYWQMQVARLAVMGHLPFGSALRKFKRRLAGYAPDASNIAGTVDDLAAMEQALAGLARSFAGARVMEIGSGWFPTIPLALVLRGAREVLMTDHERHLDGVTFSAAVEHLRARYPAFQTLPAGARLQDFPLRYLAPFRPPELPDGSVDFIISRTVLEHIEEAELRALLGQLAMKLAPGGLMVHCIDHSDHLAHRDARIGMLNFLTWPDWQHRLVNRLTREGENRLGHSDYQRLFSQAGLRVLAQVRTRHAATAQGIGALRQRLAPRFQGRSDEDLATLRSLFVLAPASAPVQHL
jgi:cyclopropane fatty-acyl-phospholipid synthase-like methyltransferase